MSCTFKISVIIPVYNLSIYLNRCLESVINQTLKDIEIIIIDDGSTDESPSIIQEYAKKDPRVRFYIGSNQGVVCARSQGLSMSTAPYVYYLDGDDFLMLDAMEVLYQKAVNEEAKMVFFDYQVHDDLIDGSVTQQSLYWEELSSEEWLKNAFLGEIQWAVWTHIHKRELYEYVDFSLLKDLSIGEDAVLTSLLVHASNKVYKVNEVKINYVIREKSVTRISGLSDQAYASYILFPERLNRFFINREKYLSLDKGCSYVYVRSALETLYKRRYDKAHLICKRAAKALRKYPEFRKKLDRRMLKLIKLFSLAQFIGAYYMRECIRKNKI